MKWGVPPHDPPQERSWGTSYHKKWERGSGSGVKARESKSFIYIQEFLKSNVQDQVEPIYHLRGPRRSRL